MAYTRLEQETTIRWDEEEKLARIYTASPISIRKLDKLCQDHPDEYICTWSEKNSDGRTTAAKYEVYKGFVRFSKPRTMTEEQREIAKVRLAQYRAEH